jgi:hypothetical protein
MLAFALAVVAGLALSACSSGGSSDEAGDPPTPGEAGPNEVLVVVNNEFRQSISLSYQFASGQPRTAGTVSPGRTKELTIRPLTGDLIFLVRYSDSTEQRSNAMQVRGGETYELLVRDNFRPQLIRRN